MNIYVDESIHEQHGFMLLAFVMCQRDPQDNLDRILSKHVQNEFHACSRMHDNVAMKSLRVEIKSYINLKCKWGVLILPSDNRNALADDFSHLIEKLAENEQEQSISLYVDEGIISKSEADDIGRTNGVAGISICRSHEVNGIQLADLVAALCGVRLREEISGNPKILTYGDEAGFVPLIEAELGYELWAGLWYSMNRNSEPQGEDMPDMAMFDTTDCGLFLSNNCSDSLRDCAGKLFGNVYLGCIH